MVYRLSKYAHFIPRHHPYTAKNIVKVISDGESDSMECLNQSLETYILCF